MFIYQPEMTSQKAALIEKTKQEFSVMPPHWELFAMINPKRFEMFLNEIRYLLQHPHINPDFFALMRLYVANREGFVYCKSFNTKLLLTKGYEKKDLQAYKEEIGLIPLDERHALLAKAVEKALYKPLDFGIEDIEALKCIGWSDADIYDAVDHGAFLFKFSKILKAFGA